MENQKIIDKVKKLLSLATSNNSNEAGLAMARARELMDKHGITSDQIAVSSIKEADGQSGRYETPPDYVVSLAQTVAQLFQCGTFWRTSSKVKWNESKGFYTEYNTCPVFIGVEPHQQICSYTYNYLHRLLISARKSYPVYSWESKSQKTATRNSFAIGWVHGIYRQVKEMVPPAPVTLSEGTGIVAVDPFKAYIENAVEGTIEPRGNRPSDDTALLYGLSEGSKVQINKGMADSGQLQIN